MSWRLCQILTFPFQYHQGSPDLVPFHGWIIFLSVCWYVYIMVSFSIHLSMDTKPAFMSWLLQIILQWTLGTYRCKPHWPPKPRDLELSLGSNWKHQGTRQVPKFLSRRYCPAGMRQRGQRRLLPASKPPERVKWEAGPSGWCFKINSLFHRKSGPFSATVPVPGSKRVTKFMLPFKSCFSHHEPGGSCRCQFHWLSKVDVWGLISQVQAFKGGVPNLGFRPFTSQGAAGDGSFLPIVGHHTGSGVDGETMSQPLLSTLMWAVCHMCRSYSEEETITWVATDVMCPWEEVNVVGSSALYFSLDRIRRTEAF